MQWALLALFLVAALLLIFSYIKNIQSSKQEQREIDSIYMSMMEEVTKLQNQIRHLEIEGEIFSEKVGMGKEELLLLRDSLDLYKRGYTIEGIAGKMKVDAEEVEQLLAPYMNVKNEGRKIENES